MSEIDERKLLALIEAKARPWRGEPDYEDMLSEAYVLALLGLRSVHPEARSPEAVAAHWAQYGRACWLKRWNKSDRNKFQLQFVPLETLYNEPAERFETQVLDRMEASDLWRTIVSCCTPHQQRVLHCLVVEGRRVGECAELLGCSSCCVSNHYRQAVERCRERLR